ncbi:23S rRNA (uracil(1939)-C(5))-methyltransferase RlmD [Thermoproteota archaeon]
MADNPSFNTDKPSLTAAPPSKQWLERHKPYPIVITKLVYQGWGLGMIGGFKIFVPSTIPGDEVEIEIESFKRRYAFGKVISIIKPSEMRADPVCRHFSKCGGCQILQVDYTNQLRLKTEILKDCIRGFFPALESKLLPIKAAESNLYYRNKMEYAFSEQDNQIVTGLKKRGAFDQIIPLEHCYLMSPQSNDIRKAVCAFFNAKKNTAAIAMTNAAITSWNYHTHQGLLRYLGIRHSKTFDQYMINLVVSEYNETLLQEFSQYLCSAFTNIITIVVSVQPEKGDTALSDDVRILSGPGYIKERLGSLEFIISPLSFFQTNTSQAEVLYQTIADTADLKEGETILDLYCGTGSIGMFLTQGKIKDLNIIGIEENKQAIKDAEQNTIYNQIPPITYYSGRVKNILKFNTFHPDCVITDPPRSGMVPKALRRMAELNAPKIIYVSCHPANMLRDLKDICAYGYNVEEIQPVDMFPNTYHIENVVKLTK